MTEKRRRDEPQSGLPNGGPTSKLNRALKSIVTVQSTIPEDAFTAQTLGEQRSGSGVVIRESGLVLTIGYLITEAENVWLADAEGRVTPAHALAIDAETGFGLVQALGDLKCPALELGRSSEAKLGDPVTVAAGAGTKPVRAMIVGKQEFAGYWEYFLDEAIFTSPAHPFWGGAGGDRRGGQAGWHRLVACRATQREGRPARHQHDRADRPSAADPRRSPHLRPGQQARAALAWRFFGRKWRRDHRRERRRTGTGRRSGNPARRRSRGRRRLGDRKSRRFLSQGLEPRSGRGRDSARNHSRRPGDRLARAFGRPHRAS